MILRAEKIYLDITIHLMANKGIRYCLRYTGIFMQDLQFHSANSVRTNYKIYTLMKKIFSLVICICYFCNQLVIYAQVKPG